METLFEDRYNLFDGDKNFHVFKSMYLDAMHDKFFPVNEPITPRTTTIENVLFDIKKINDKHTTHSSVKNRRISADTPNEKMGPTIDTINDFFSSLTMDTIDDNQDTLIENECVFFYSVASNHVLMQHMWLCFQKQIFYFYDMLKTNPDTHIVFEIIPERPESPLITGRDYIAMTRPNINNVISFLRHIGLQNKIHVVSNWSGLNTINTPLCFKKTHYMGFDCMPDYRKFLVLSISMLDINIPAIAKQMIYDNRDSPVNKKYENGKRLCILEERTNRSIPQPCQNYIHNKVANFCKEKDLQFYLWKQASMPCVSLYEQMVITFHADVAVGYGGSHWLFNFAMQKGSILIINLCSEANVPTINALCTQCLHYTNYGSNPYYPLLDRYILFHDIKQIFLKCDLRNIPNGFMGVVDTFLKCLDEKKKD